MRTPAGALDTSHGLISSSARYWAALQDRSAAVLSRPPLDQFETMRPVPRADLEPSTADIHSGGHGPAWVHDARRTPVTSENLNSRVLDVLWGQYALFLYIRIQDDLLDGQSSD